MTRASDVLRALHRGCDGLVELRALPSRARVFGRVDDPALAAFVARHQATENLYWGVASRRDATSGRAENCGQLGALFADLDFNKVDEGAARARLLEFELPASCVIHSGGGLHAYWFLSPPLPIEGQAARVDGLLRRLAHAVSGDRVVAEVARVLRVPGTLNQKYAPPALVRVERFQPELRYDVSDIEALLPKAPQATGAPSLPANWTPPPASSDRVERGRAYLRGMGPAIQGAGGDRQTYRAACWLVCDLALSDSDAMDVLREWNQGCSPPWTEGELWAKVQHARRYGRHPVGLALAVDRPRVINVKVQVA